METEFNDIKQLLDSIHEMQQRHIKTFNTDHVQPDIEQQSAEREAAFNTLKQKVAGFITLTENSSHEDAKSMLAGINESISGLMEQNRVLEASVIKHKDRLQKNLKQISRGKQALGSYKSPAVVKNRPKVISLTN